MNLGSQKRKAKDLPPEDQPTKWPNANSSKANRACLPAGIAESMPNTKPIEQCRFDSPMYTLTSLNCAVCSCSNNMQITGDWEESAGKTPPFLWIQRWRWRQRPTKTNYRWFANTMAFTSEYSPLIGDTTTPLPSEDEMDEVLSATQLTKEVRSFGQSWNITVT